MRIKVAATTAKIKASIHSTALVCFSTPFFFQNVQCTFAYLARLMSGFNDYKVYIEETHHIHKLDAPSGTAITLAQGILDHHPAYKAWELVHEIPLSEDVIPVIAKREGEVWYQQQQPPTPNPQRPQQIYYYDNTKFKPLIS